MEEPQQTPPTPAMDVVAPPPSDPPDAPAPRAVKPPAPQKTPPPRQHRPASPAGTGVTGAIIATVIIVLGLAALAVYAYLKQPR